MSGFVSWEGRSGSCHSQNRPSIATDEGFFRGMLGPDACAPGINREGVLKGREAGVGFVEEFADTLDHFQFVTFNGDGDRTLDRRDGNHQFLIPTLREDTLDAVEATASNSYPLSDLQEGVQSAGSFPRKQQLQVFNLSYRNRSRYPSGCDKPDDTFGL